MRLAGLLDLVHNITPPATEHRVPAEAIQLAMNIVDTLVAETRLFHQGPKGLQDLLMQKVHEHSWNNGKPRSVNWQTAKTKLATTKDLRALGAGGYQRAIVELQDRGFGTVNHDGRPSYIATRAMP